MYQGLQPFFLWLRCSIKIRTACQTATVLHILCRCRTKSLKAGKLSLFHSIRFSIRLRIEKLNFNPRVELKSGRLIIKIGVSAMIPSKESLTAEFKSDQKKYPDAEIFEAVVALANTEGGALYLGVEDSGKITGVHPSHNNTLTLPAFIANNTVPPLSVRSEILPTTPPVLKISVPKSLNSIVATASGKVLHRRLKANGEPENVIMYPSEFATRLSDLRLLDYSALLVDEADMSMLDKVEIDRLRRLISFYQGDKVLASLANDDLCKALGLARVRENTLYPTITGILLVGTAEAVARFVPTSKTSFQILKGSDVAVNQDIQKPLLSTVEEIFLLLEKIIEEKEYSLGPYRIAIPNYDQAAVREAVVNAFCHRDYSVMGRVRILVSDEGVSVSNPGGFIDGVNLNNLITVEPHGRNPLLADVMKRIGLAERTGRGIDRIFEGSLRYGKSLPDYSQSTGSTVTVFFPKSSGDWEFAKQIIEIQNKNNQELSVTSLFILYLLNKNDGMDLDELSLRINIPRAVLQVALETLVKNNAIYYTVNKKVKIYSLSCLKEQKAKRNDNASLQEMIEKIVQLAQKRKLIKNSDVVSLLGIDADKAYRLLQKLQKAGVLQKHGRGRYTTYSIK